MSVKELHLRLTPGESREMHRLQRLFGRADTTQFVELLLKWATEAIGQPGPLQDQFAQRFSLPLLLQAHERANAVRGRAELPLGPLETLASHSGRSVDDLLKLSKDATRPGHFLASIAILFDALAAEVRYLAQRVDAQGASTNGSAEPTT